MATETSDEMKLKVRASLESGPYACTSLVKLSGGTANFVYRGTLITPLPDGSKTVVIKHTEGYVAQSPGFKLTTTRCDYEQAILTALTTLPPSTHSNITVHTPKMHFFSPSTNTQIYSDLPSSLDLKTYILTHASSLTQPQCTRLGHALGLWTRKFHDWAQADEQVTLVETMKGNEAMRNLKYAINYNALVGMVEKFPKVLEGCGGVFGEVRDAVREEGESGKGLLIHGDFWSGNILLPSFPLPSPSTQVSVLVIDWELSQISSIAFDLGQIFAELFQLKHFKNIDAGVWLIEAFMKGYGSIGEDLAFRIAVHVGVHLMVWGSRVQGWGSGEQVESVVERGRECVVGGWRRVRGVFDGGPLACLFV